MGAEKDLGLTVMKYTRIEDQSSGEDSYDSDRKETEIIHSRRIPSGLSLPPRELKEQSVWKSPSGRLILSPKESREQNDAAVAAAGDVAAKRFARQHRRWRATVMIRAFSTILSRLSPASALRRARDSYVRSVGNFASQFSSSTACGVTYGAGQNSVNKLPAAWRSESYRYRVPEEVSDTCMSSAFKQSLKETHMSQGHSRSRSFGPQTARQPRRVSSARLYSSTKYGVQPMIIYTITETS